MTNKMKISLKLKEKKYLSFEVKIHTKEFENAIDELEIKNGKRFKTIQELFKDLDS